MVSNDVEEAHIKGIDKLFQLIALSGYGFPGILFSPESVGSLDKISDADGELRTQKIHRLHRSAEDARPFAASAVGNDRKVELVRIIQKRLFCIRYSSGSAE